MANDKKPQIGDAVRVRQLGKTEVVSGEVAVIHDVEGPTHITVHIDGPNGQEIESVGFDKGLSVDGSWDW